jgi:hypothetical protein
MEMRDVLQDSVNIYKVQGNDCNSVPKINRGKLRFKMVTNSKRIL